MTSEPVFVNTISEERYAILEDSGQLVQPGEAFEYANYGEGVRVRNMHGETVLYFPGNYSEDETHNIVSLEADPSAPPVAQPFSWGLGTSTGWSATVCDDGSTRNIKEFGLLVDVRNQQDRPLVVEIFERFSDTDEPPVISGAFVRARDEAAVAELVVAEPWLRAFDQTGALVYTAPLVLEETQTITIPADPGSVREIPRQDLGRTQGRGSDCGNLWNIVLPIALIIATIGLFGGGIFLLVWMITVVRRRNGKFY
jgi:hypothetical protein